MPRKTNRDGSTSRRKKAAASVPPPAVHDVRDVPGNAKLSNLDEEIRRRAYELYLERRGTAGDQHHDWLIAEREIRARYQHEHSA